MYGLGIASLGLGSTVGLAKKAKKLDETAENSFIQDISMTR